MNFTTLLKPAHDSSNADLICFCHLRWDFVFQRPQHLMTRFAQDRRVFFVEEPIVDSGTPRIDTRRTDSGVIVLTPRIPIETDTQRPLAELFNEFLRANQVSHFVSWYYSPMFLPETRHLRPNAVVYDCMDELSAFKFADPRILDLERELLSRADLVFTGGSSLYEAKRTRHARAYLFPSSVDSAHFAKARSPLPRPDDVAHHAGPRIGFCGVIDERMDIALIDGIAAARPDWRIQLVGPVVKIDRRDLPQRPNIEYLGQKSYDELPHYIAQWDVAILPFARNESTRFISPTKTPEYLAAGRAVVSTSIQDVVRTYGDHNLVHFADNVEGFVAAIERALAEDAEQRIAKVDRLLSQQSWTSTWRRMGELISDVLDRKQNSTDRAKEHAAARTLAAKHARVGGIA